MAFYDFVLLDNEDKVAAPCTYLEKIKDSHFKNIYAFVIRANQTASTTELEVGGTQASFSITTATQLLVASTSTEDVVAGTYARKVKLFGYNSTTGWIAETVTLTGTVPVTTTAAFNYAFNVRLAEWGSNAVAAGNITLADIAGSTTYCTLTASGTGSNGTKILIPAGYRAVVTSIHGANTTVDANKLSRNLISYRRLSTTGFNYNPNWEKEEIPLDDDGEISQPGCIKANKVFTEDTYFKFYFKAALATQTSNIAFKGYVFK